jgi:catechol 1,2-dioxygenase
MGVKINDKREIQELLRAASGLTVTGGNPRTKQIVHRILSDLCRIIEDLNVTPEEFWVGVNYLNDLGAAGEAGLLAPGLGLEHYLDLRMDAEDAQAGVKTGTSRTVEGPLYVTGAPLSEGFARLDDGSSQDGKTLIMQGRVFDQHGKPLAGAIVDVWHANAKGFYSHFDPTQSQPAFNLRRRIRTDADGRYRFQSIVPRGYGCPPDGPTQALLNLIGRHGQRPSHIHFFVGAAGFRRLTTQVNIAGDKYLHDDFAYATREDLIAEIRERSDEAGIKANNLSEPYAEIEFDFTLTPLSGVRSDAEVERRRVTA